MLGTSEEQKSRGSSRIVWVFCFNLEPLARQVCIVIKPHLPTGGLMRGRFLPYFVITLVSAVITTAVRPIQYLSTLREDNCQAFKETGIALCGKFLAYWQTNGGLSQYGYPISKELPEQSSTDFKVYTVQYFERAMFELHPENKAPYDVLLGLLGVFENKRYYGVGYYELGGPSYQKASTDNPLFFKETGRTIGGRFRQYWERNGGLLQQGYPITDEFQEWNRVDGKRYIVQYFQRAVFELHPENKAPYDVLLSHLGTFEYQYSHSDKFLRVEHDLMYVPEYPGAQRIQVLVQIDPTKTHLKYDEPYKVVTFTTTDKPEEIFIFLRSGLVSRYWEDWRPYLAEQGPSLFRIRGSGRGVSPPMYTFVATTVQQEGLTYVRVERFYFGGM